MSYRRRWELRRPGRILLLGVGLQWLGFEVGDADEEDVALLLAVKSFHRVHIPDQTLAFRCEAEAFEYGLDDQSAANRTAYGWAGHGTNSGVMGDGTPVLNPIQYLQVIATVIRPRAGWEKRTRLEDRSSGGLCRAHGLPRVVGRRIGCGRDFDLAPDLKRFVGGGAPDQFHPFMFSRPR